MLPYTVAVASDAVWPPGDTLPHSVARGEVDGQRVLSTSKLWLSRFQPSPLQICTGQFLSIRLSRCVPLPIGPDVPILRYSL